MRPDNPGVHLSMVEDSDSDRAWVVCNLCGAIEDGNASCWACVDRWQGFGADLLEILLRQRDEKRRELLAMIYAEIARRVFGPNYAGRIDGIRVAVTRIVIDHTVFFNLAKVAAIHRIEV